MTTTVQISETPKHNHVVAVVKRDGQSFGQVIMRGRKFEARRNLGTQQDMRRVSRGYATIEKAVAWITAAADAHGLQA